VPLVHTTETHKSASAYCCFTYNFYFSLVKL